MPTEIFYHGSTQLFDEFDHVHAMEGNGALKFGYGVYVTSHYSSAAHYAKSKDNPDARHYVYTVEVPAIAEDNYIAFKEAVKPSIVAKAEKKLGCAIPDKAKSDGKEFRKFIARKLNGGTDVVSEFMASNFLFQIGVRMIVWPYSWVNPAKGTNRAILMDNNVKIIKIEEVELDEKNRLIDGSQKEVQL